MKQQLRARLDNQEKVFQAYCKDEGIVFISPTSALQREMAEGVRVYYTYDQHWTWLGHQVVAAEVVSALEHL